MDAGLVAAPDTGNVDVVVNVPSWPIARDVPVTTSRGEVTVTVAYGGVIYATLPAPALALSVTPAHLGELIRSTGRSSRPWTTARTPLTRSTHD